MDYSVDIYVLLGYIKCAVWYKLCFVGFKEYSGKNLMEKKPLRNHKVRIRPEVVIQILKK